MKFPTKIASSANIDSDSLAKLTNWARKVPAKELRKAKGNLGENVLHWAAVSNESLIYFAKERGVDINAVDKFGLTPLDWLINRSYLLTLQDETEHNVHDLGLFDTRKQALALGPTLLGMGAKTSESEEKETPIVLRMMKGGLSPLVDVYVERYGIDCLIHWMNESSALHFWSFMPEVSDKARLLAFLVKSLDVQQYGVDENGNTPVHYATMALANDFELYQKNINDFTFMTLEEAGFDLNQKNKEGKMALDYYPALYLMQKKQEMQHKTKKKNSLFSWF
jgi:hypothetical protein